MSLVGPRPLIESEDRQLERLARAAGSTSPPGMTGLWQVLGRTSIPFEEMVKLDYLYVTNWSLWTDVRLMLRDAAGAGLWAGRQLDAHIRGRAGQGGPRRADRRVAT